MAKTPSTRKMRTKIIYTYNGGKRGIFIPDWVEQIMRLKTNDLYAEYNVNLEFLTLHLPDRGRIVVWKANNGKGPLKVSRIISPIKVSH